MNPKISVIVPVYNTEKYLDECISSIINQTFEDFEVICIDDGSTDNSLEILNEFAKNDSRVRVFHQENQGPSSSRNVGLDLAEGDYVIFMDSDDYFELTAFEECYSIAEELSLDFLIFKLLNFDNETGEKVYRKNYEMKFIKDKVGDNVFDYHDVLEYFFKVSPTSAAKLFKRELLSDQRYVEGLIFEDNVFIITTLVKAKRIYFYDRHLYHRRLREGSVTHSHHHAFSDCVEIYEIILKILEDNNVYDLVKEQFLRNQCKDVFNRFVQVNDEYKADFFEKIQRSFSGLKDKYESEGILSSCSEKTRTIFYSAIESQSGDEFVSRVNTRLFEVKQMKLNKKINSLREKNDKLKKKNEKLKKENRKLKKEIDELNDMNSSILNSKSWKMTAPLRKLKNLK